MKLSSRTDWQSVHEREGHHEHRGCRRRGRRDQVAQEEDRRHHPGPLLPGRRDPGTGRLHRRQPEAGPRRHQGDDAGIVFCGVHFMAETAKMLNPAKRVLLPDLQAGCSLADSCPADKLARYQEMLRINGRKFQTVTYINSTAAVKALSDWVVTSGNAEEIIRRVPEEYEILFVPDRHLGQYLEEVTGRKMILWNGSCMVHEIFSVGDLLALKKQDAARRDDRPSGVPGQHPRAHRLRRRHRGDAQVRRRLRGADRLPGRDRGEHDVAAADASTRSTAIIRCRASPAPATSARTWPATRWRSSATAW